MATYVGRIGRYRLHFPIWEIENMRSRSSSRTYFQQKKISVSFAEFVDDINDVTEELELPLTQFFNIKKDKKSGMYFKDWESFDIRKVLWDELIKRKIKISIIPYLHIHRDEKSATFYLKSRVLDNPIQLISEEMPPQTIETYDAFKWLDANCLVHE